MADYGVTSSGFVVKPLTQILADTQTALATVADPTTGESLTVNLSNENDPLVNIVNSICNNIATCWEQLELCYNQFNPLLATGAGLSGTVLLNGIQRRAGSATTVSLDVVGTPNLSISAGYEVTTVDGDLNFTLPAFTFSVSGTATVTATCTEIGENAVAANTVTRLAQPITGVTSVNNPAAGTLGSDEETDAALLARQQGSACTPSRTVIGSMWSNLFNLDGVTYCRVFQNRYLSTDARGLPPKTVAAVLIGGDDTEIASCLLSTAGIGVNTYGTTTIQVADEQDILYDVKFSRPENVEIYVDISLTVINPGVWPVDAIAQIQQAIINYAQDGASGIGVTTGFDQVGYAPGDPVYSSELYTPVNSITGARINSLYIGTSSSPSATAVTIAWNQIAHFTDTNIAVTIV